MYDYATQYNLHSTDQTWSRIGKIERERTAREREREIRRRNKMKLCIEMKFEFRSISFEWKITHPRLSLPLPCFVAVVIYLFRTRNFSFASERKNKDILLTKSGRRKQSFSILAQQRRRRRPSSPRRQQNWQWTFFDELEQSYLFILNFVCKFDFRFCIFVSLFLSTSSGTNFVSLFSVDRCGASCLLWIHSASVQGIRRRRDRCSIAPSLTRAVSAIRILSREGAPACVRRPKIMVILFDDFIEFMFFVPSSSVWLNFPWTQTTKFRQKKKWQTCRGSWDNAAFSSSV